MGPVWHGGDDGEAELLASCYRRSIEVAAERAATSIAFPAISTGVYHYPRPAAAAIAVATLLDCAASIDRVRLVAFDEETYDLYRALLATPE